MNLEAHLLKYRTPAELASELAAAARDKVKLLDRVGALEHELFWIEVRESDTVRALRLENEQLRQRAEDLAAALTQVGVSSLAVRTVV